MGIDTPAIPDRAAEALSRLRSQNETLQLQNEELRSELDVARVRLMQLQGGDHQITDMQIHNRMNDLYEETRRWVTDIESYYKRHSRDFGVIFNKAIDEGKALALAQLVFGINKPVDDHCNMEWMRWLGDQPNCMLVILSMVVWGFLNEKIFAYPFPIGVSGTLCETFRQIVQVLGKHQEDQDGTARPPNDIR